APLSSLLGIRSPGEPSPGPQYPAVSIANKKKPITLTNHAGVKLIFLRLSSVKIKIKCFSWLRYGYAPYHIFKQYITTTNHPQATESSFITVLFLSKPKVYLDTM